MMQTPTVAPAEASGGALSAIDEATAALNDALDAWSRDVADLMPFGAAVVARSVRHLVSDHVDRLRTALGVPAEVPSPTVDAAQFLPDLDFSRPPSTD